MNKAKRETIHEWHSPDGWSSLSIICDHTTSIPNPKRIKRFHVLWASGADYTSKQLFYSLDDTMNFVNALSKAIGWQFLENNPARRTQNHEN